MSVDIQGRVTFNNTLNLSPQFVYVRVVTGEKNHDSKLCNNCRLVAYWRSRFFWSTQKCIRDSCV